MGDTRTPKADSSERMTKPPQYCKIISLQLKFKKGKKKFFKSKWVIKGKKIKHKNIKNK